jgi:N4-gp56 family major capsid protein
MNTVSIAGLRPQIWEKELYADTIAGLYFQGEGIIGSGSNNIVQIKDGLSKTKGDHDNVGLTAKLSGEGVDGDDELEGNEEQILSYSDAYAINQKRFAVRLTGAMDEQSVAYDMRVDAKDKLSIRMQEFIERQIFLKAAGVTNTTLVDVAGVASSLGCSWSNAPTVIPQADEAAGVGSRYICANANGTDALAATDLMTPQLIERARIKARLCNPKIRPIKVGGKGYYVLWVHPWQAYDLRQNATYAQAMREAEARGSDNPIFTGAMGIWGGVIVKEHEYVPWLDVSVAGNSFQGAATGTDCAVDCARALLCGAQAVVWEKCKSPKGWVEKTFDYENQVGFATSMIAGFDKVVFNALEYGVIAVDTATTSLL